MTNNKNFSRFYVLLTIVTSAFVSACNSTPTPAPTTSPSPKPSSSQGSSGSISDQKVDFATAPPKSVQLNSCDALTLQVENAKTSVPETAHGEIFVSLYFLDAIPYSDSACTSLIGSYIFQAGQQTAKIYYKTISAGQATLELSTTDTMLIYTDQITYTQTVQAGAPSALQMYYPTSVIVGTTMPSVSACVSDNLGNIVPQAGTSISLQLASNPSGATLSGTLTRVTSSSGCAAFNDLSLDLAGVYTLQASGENFTRTTGNITAAENSGPAPSPSPSSSSSSGSSSGSGVDCTNIANANVSACAGTDPSYCMNPNYANFAPCTGSHPSYCSITAYAGTLACTGSNPNGVYCQENPSALGCPEYCTYNPNAQQCPNFCNANPTAAGCPEYCDVNPTAQGCPEFCDFNPTGQGCPTFCDENPTAQGCPEYCTFNPTAQGCPEFCDFNPTAQGCPEYCQLNPFAAGC